ncbi:MAG: hypothetical protein JSV92_00775 [archaeon]|nr:MAG: hypothetical protein JSV92_00775 [archaeon]
MVKYPVKAGKEEVKAAGIGLPISSKKSVVVCRRINRMKLEKSKRFLQSMIEGKNDINGKRFTKTCKEILKILESAEKNAQYGGLENPVIKTISVEKGARRLRMRRRRSFGSALKNTNIKVILKEGGKPGEKKKPEKVKEKVEKNEHKKQVHNE